MLRDTFICHASEDKNDVVRPLVESFTDAGVSCWFDEAEIQWGDSITQKVNEGLAKSRYVIVVLSPAFLQKNWPQRELYAVLNQEASTGEVKVLPLLVGTEQEKKQILNQLPLLNDKRYLPWGGEMRGIVEAMLSRLGRKGKGAKTASEGTAVGSPLRVPLPKIKKQFSQRDKDLFLRSGFTVVMQYFENALGQLNRQHQEIETDLQEVYRFKFVATIYVGGAVGSRCKIWIGGLTSSDSLAFSYGQVSIENDHSFNDILSVGDNGHALGFRPSGMWMTTTTHSEKDLLSPEQTAEYLWRRFIEPLT